MAALLPLPAMAAANQQNPPAQQSAAQQQDAQHGKTVVVLPARQLLNRDLIDPEGRSAGRVAGIVLDTGNGAVDFVVVAGRGNFDLNGQVIALPWSTIIPPKAASGPLRIKVSVDKLAKAPRLNPHALAVLEQPRMRANMYGYYTSPYGWGPNGCYGAVAGPYGCYGYGYGARRAGLRAPYPGGPAPAIAANGNHAGQTNAAGNSANAHSGGNTATTNNTAGSGSSAANGSQSHASATGNNGATQSGNGSSQAGQLVRNGLVVGPSGVVSAIAASTTTSASAMRSAQVFTANGRNIGHVERVMIDPDHGEVAFVLIKEGGFLGLSPKWFAAPVEALHWTPYQGGYRLTVDAQALAGNASVQVNENALPQDVSRQDLAELYRHFNIRPYWESGQAQAQTQGHGGAGSGSGSSGGSGKPPAK